MASTTITGSVAVTQSTSPWVVSLTSTTITGTVLVDGALTNNTAAPSTNLLGVMSHLAETAYGTVTYTTGDVVLAVVDLHGATNVDLQAYAGTALGAPSNYGTSPGAVEVMGVNAFITNTPAVTLASTTITGTVAVTQSTSPWLDKPSDTQPATGNITAADAASTTTSGFDSQSIVTGTPTANSFVSFAISGEGTIIVQATGTWVGTLSLEASMDGGTTWYASSAHLAGTTFQASSGITANFSGISRVSGQTNFRVRATAWTSGTAIIAVSETPNAGSSYVINPIKILDTANVASATVKAASTQAASTDTSLVVTLNPNQPNLTTPLNIVGPVSTTASAVAATTVTSTSGSILSANSARMECTVVNTGVVVVYLGLNGKTPTATAYHIALSPCTTINDGTGGTYTTDIMKGAINAIVASASGTVCVTELTA